MTAPVLFWMESNSSTDFGLTNHLQQFQFGWVFKKTSPLLAFSFSNLFYKPTNPILRPTTPLPLSLAFLVGLTLEFQMSLGAMRTAPSLSPLFVPM
jgi:hypothetical protein